MYDVIDGETIVIVITQLCKSHFGTFKWIPITCGRNILLKAIGMQIRNRMQAAFRISATYNIPNAQKYSQRSFSRIAANSKSYI